MSRNRLRVIRIAVSLSLFAVAAVLYYIFEPPIYLSLPIFIAIYLVISYDILIKAAKNIIHGEIFDENFLMIIATVGAFALQEFPEAVAVMILYQIGEAFQSYAVDRSRKSISAIKEIRPDTATVKREGKEYEVFAEEISVGEIIVVKPGERVALDGTVVSGRSYLDTSALTGESVPRFADIGDEVLSGTINKDSLLEIKVEKEYYDSTASKILDLVENVSTKKAKAENFITKFAKVYTPIVVGLAVILAVVPSIITGDVSVWVERALAFLMVSCPCALVISVPLAFFAAIGNASGEGILIKGGNYLEALSGIDTFVFDKTGTLTKGNLKVSAVLPEENREYILKTAAKAEIGSTHPIARAIVDAAGAVRSDYSLREIAGKGMIAEKGKNEIVVGNKTFMEENGFEVDSVDIGTAVFVAENGNVIGKIIISDELREDAAATVAELKLSGAECVMLSGDSEAAAASVAKELSFSSYRAKLLPSDKLSVIEELKSKGRKVAFVGDGINDSPVLAGSDVGFAMGKIGSDSAIEVADVVLMHDELRAIPKAKKIASKTLRIVKECIAFSLTVKIAVLILSAFGITNMWVAVASDVVVAMIAILNAMRTGRKSK